MRKILLALSLLSLLVACASSEEKQGLDKVAINSAELANASVAQTQSGDEVITEMRPPTDTSATAEAAKQHDGFQVELKKIKDLAETSHVEPRAHSADKHPEAPAGIAPEKALGWLKNGNTRFRKGNLRTDGQSRKDISRLAAGQKPHTIIISCSDSRTPPEIVFDQKLGEIFVVRTAGQALDPNAIASVEYAVEHLGARNVVVMGHTQCGAVKAAWGTPEGQSAGSPSLDALVADIRPRISSLQTRGHSSKDFESEGWANAQGVAQDLLSRSQLLQTKAGIGQIKITAALYHLDSGHVDFK